MTTSSSDELSIRRFAGFLVDARPDLETCFFSSASNSITSAFFPEVGAAAFGAVGAGVPVAGGSLDAGFLKKLRISI